MNRRSSKIFLCSELVEVRYRNVAGSSALLMANLEEISTDGATLSLEQPLQQTAEVEITCQRGTLRGTVVGGTCDELGYTAWVEFADESRWSPARFFPKHLLDLGAFREKHLKQAA